MTLSQICLSAPLMQVWHSWPSRILCGISMGNNDVLISGSRSSWFMWYSDAWAADIPSLKYALNFCLITSSIWQKDKAWALTLAWLWVKVMSMVAGILSRTQWYRGRECLLVCLICNNRKIRTIKIIRQSTFGCVYAHDSANTRTKQHNFKLKTLYKHKQHISLVTPQSSIFLKHCFMVLLKIKTVFIEQKGYWHFEFFSIGHQTLYFLTLYWHRIT